MTKGFSLSAWSFTFMQGPSLVVAAKSRTTKVKRRFWGLPSSLPDTEFPSRLSGPRLGFIETRRTGGLASHGCFEGGHSFRFQ